MKRVGEGDICVVHIPSANNLADPLHQAAFSQSDRISGVKTRPVLMEGRSLVITLRGVLKEADNDLKEAHEQQALIFISFLLIGIECACSLSSGAHYSCTAILRTMSIFTSAASTAPHSRLHLLCSSEVSILHSIFHLTYTYYTLPVD